MARTRNIDMTSGSPLKLLLAFALPMLIGNVFQQLYNLVDSAVVGKFVGPQALAAVGATGSVTFLFFSISGGISGGCGIVTSQFFGAQEETKVRQSIANSAYISFASSFIMALTAYLLAPALLRAMQTPEEILADAIVYIRVNCVGVPLVCVYNYASSMQRALGDSVTPLYFLILSCFLNIILDLFFVCVLNMSVFGAALATIIAQLIAGIGCFLYALKKNPYFRLKREELRPDGEIISRSIRLGLPLAMQWSMIAISSGALQVFVNTFGTSAVAAFTATNRVEQLLHQPYGSLCSALSTYGGQNFGARRIDRVKLGLKQGMYLQLAFSALMLLVMQIFSGAIMTVFVNDEEVISIGRTALRVTSWFYAFLGTINVTRGILNGVGDAMFSFVNGFVEMLARIFIPMLIVYVPGIGMWGIWWTTGLAWGVSALFCVLRYLSWQRKNKLPA